jgi:hypothetical protein
MLFTLHQPVRQAPLNIHINNQKLDCVASTKFLGVYIDNRLSWDHHISYVSSKISKSAGIIRKVSQLVPRSVCITLYNTLVMPYFSYCNIVWGNSTKQNLDRLVKLQKRAVRSVCNVPYRHHTEQLFLDCNFMPFLNLHPYFCGVFLYRLLNDLLPSTFTSSFHVTFVNNRSLRRAHHLLVPRFRTTFGQKSLLYELCKLYNEFLMPFEIFYQNLHNVKKQLKKLYSV